MSRFYDVLKNAGRSLSLPRPRPEPEEIGAVDLAGLDVPSISNFPEIDQETGLGDTPAGKTNGNSVREEFIPADPILDSTPLGIPAPVTLDRKARLLPHTPDQRVVEHYRGLRSKILQRQEKMKFRSLLVTSPFPQEGKSVTVLNLGLTFAMLPSFKVLVVDGDLRKGSLGKWLGIEDRPGLSNLVEGTAKLEDVVLKSDDFPLDFIIRGNSELPAAELLNSAKLRTHLRSITEQYDLVLVDSPPVRVVTDPILLARSCDAVLLVARAFATPSKAFEKTCQELQQFNVIGTILNGSAEMMPYHRYHSYYYNEGNKRSHGRFGRLFSGLRV